MISKSILLTLLIAYTEARFGQEQVPIADISAVQGGDPGAAATIAGAAVSDLLGAANACDKLERADQIIAELGTGADAIAAAIGMVTAEKNTNPFANGNAQKICADPNLPATEELRGITPLIDPDVDAGAGVNDLSAQTAAAPLDATGKSVFDLLVDAGFGDIVVAEEGAGGAAAGGAAGGNANENQNEANNNEQQDEQEAAQGGNANENGDAADAGQAAEECEEEEAAASNENANNANEEADNANAGNANQNNDEEAAAGGNANQNANEEEEAAAGNQNEDEAAAGAAAGGNANQNANEEEAAAGNQNEDGAAAGAAVEQSSIAGLDFGTCIPTIIFEGGLGGRPADEFTFQIADPVAAEGQQEALNPNIITNRMCDQLTNVCGANEAAIAACEDAKAQVEALGTRDKSTADTFNSLLGFDGFVTNPSGGPAAAGEKRAIKFRA
ncbi:hypothetical protein K469DRAFT_249292 [Zopfia rhizophila CBS 207.26]|uniref:Circumsporozoite protein n=1 Tax=Zopfia rhizophila CBS 207.26 TaxID=1314779 RepID=A0A6A6DUK3_9PEZI|nr:hypothetical protein K469DRAFT_249292 [Zopfia rhizophila CBS 207.26]